MKTAHTKRTLVTAVAGLAVIILAAALTMHLEWRSYQEKLQILYTVVEEAENGKQPFETVAELLKGHSTTETGVAQQELAQYGYTEEYFNYYKQRMISAWKQTAALYALLYVCFLLTIIYLQKGARSRQRELLLHLQDKISALRDGKSETGSDRDTPDKIEMGSGRDTPDKKADELWMWQEDDEELSSLLMELDSLDRSITLLREQAKAEKEETKSMVTDISHQLKTPVAALKTSIEILQSGSLTEEEEQEFIGRCSTQILRLEELVQALVQISRMETGMIEIRPEQANIFDTILLAVNRIYPGAEEKQIEIALEAAEELQKLTLPHDRKWLCEALLSVLENAVKYSGQNTRITIRMIPMRVFLRIEIEDEGIGITKAEWNRIFQRFYRGAAQEVQAQTGSGVGLYLAREIVTRHRGTLSTAAPKAGKAGSRFVFQLPYQV